MQKKLFRKRASHFHPARLVCKGLWAALASCFDRCKKFIFPCHPNVREIVGSGHPSFRHKQTSPEISNHVQFMKSDKFDNETPGSGFVASSFQSYLFLVLTFWRRILTCNGTSFYPFEECLICSWRQRKLRQMSEKVLSGRLRQEIADDISKKYP